ncbi:MAG: hypothetical protein COV55_01035 [Candidatus Komeilibacteria bacterium CG11_big_fil_rev_8_21_14_0_20_36_20]|uniref:Glycosyl transferase family 1 domain-containing protein n=1 Tax=Candidatus Komeilibacteria bacterium CG11_big_fil_rev_8_21_14_0_20_36_20 TaxID=1974477 RepID=A0A2H0NDM0_9BACT|nr:MAG: hypothetical protein COV55_01035 [Candidatus Komeilibacteria bacterium CG11_big_fil_rev_8_21_14_0_20_36_20]PIR81364.1 MAG: hypothetical protein COU21_04005 [Candidatus Komeilibacteria bacterium CG10_big_fil_rev_8_21_14_0_10_36_65]PJC54994.1 MAG: hypothetical protein CO027_04675 [Candidatus Komeilibacteria bacterium CG_4_9_14_0_2_um_filter_36_13]
MKLLMITRRVDQDDGLAGFTYNWIKKIAANLDKLYVICLEKGNDSGLPDNIRVYSLGKEKGKNRWQEFWQFQRLAVRLLPKVDGVFAHQNPEYGILIAPWAKIFRKKLIAWYTHKGVNWKLRLLNMLSDVMVTASKESFRLPSKKLIVMHHGIDSDIFYFKETINKEKLILLSVSRISPTKNIQLMIDLVRELRQKLSKPVLLKIVGAPSLAGDKIYLEELKKNVKSFNLEDSVEFVGSVSNVNTPKFYQEADIFLNFSKTGSLDKNVLEAMSCGTLVISSNVAFEDILNSLHPSLYIYDHKDMADKVIKAINESSGGLLLSLSQYIQHHQNLEVLSKEIVDLYKK